MNIFILRSIRNIISKRTTGTLCDLNITPMGFDWKTFSLIVLLDPCTTWGRACGVHGSWRSSFIQ